MDTLPEGATGEAELTVAESDLASALPLSAADTFPRVFATSRMVALMEIASARAMASCLQPGQLSVGVSLDVIHAAPSALGARVRAVARFVAREGKQFVFDVVAYDPQGEIGRARHRRAIVTVARLEAVAAGRREPVG